MFKAQQTSNLWYSNKEIYLLILIHISRHLQQLLQKEKMTTFEWLSEPAISRTGPWARLNPLPSSLPPLPSFSIPSFPKFQLRGLGSTLNSRSVVWDRASAEIEFSTF